MKMSVDKVPTVLIEFLDAELLPKSKNNTQTFMSSLVLGLAGKRLQGVIRSSGLTDADGMIDIDELEKAANVAIQKARFVEIPVIGYRADADDFAKIFAIAKKYGSE